MEERNFKGIWIPKEIWLTNELSLQEKVVLVEIDSLDDEEKGCYASNKYFADFFKLSNGRISQIIKELHKKGYLNISYNYQGKEISERVIKINKPPYPQVFNKLNTYLENDDGGIKKTKGGYLENAKENNISINNINNNKKEIYKERNKKMIEATINYLNKKTGKNYRPTTPSTVKHLTARINEGYNDWEFMDVIDTKCKDWLGTDMEKFLRPETLFGSKFENYLNQ